MKRIAILLTGICFALTAKSQTDTTKQEKYDTIRVGTMIIIKKGDGKTEDGDNEVTIYSRKKNYRKSNLTTNWAIVDIGINRFHDKTDYSSPEVQDPATGFAPGADEDWFKLRNGKSINVNIWFFMQRKSISKLLLQTGL